MNITCLTLFPEMFPGFLGYYLAGKAMKENLFSLRAVNIRDYAVDAYKTVDDVPFGGSAGMLMKADVLDAAIKANYTSGPLIYMSPRGQTLTQKRVVELAHEENVTIICGRFEGIDERILQSWPIEEISIGDFVLSGGEPAALTMLDAVIRYIPHVLGNADSLAEESFANGLLEYPQYTRPQVWNGLSVPDVLVSGHHKNIENWRKEQSIQLTKERRPDLWKAYEASQQKKG